MELEGKSVCSQFQREQYNERSTWYLCDTLSLKNGHRQLHLLDARNMFRF